MFGLFSHGVSVAFQASGWFCTFVEAAVVVSGACISKSLDYSLRCYLANAGLSEYKKKKKKKKKILQWFYNTNNLRSQSFIDINNNDL